MRKWRTFAVVLAAAVIAPGTAYATSAIRNFNPANLDYGVWKKIGTDWSMPARSNTGVFGDIAGCPSGTHTVHGRMMRNRTALPDVQTVSMASLAYCPIDQFWPGSWPAGTFHFDAANATFDNPSAAGNFEAWW
jgi:hypothetical protein